MGSQLRRVDLGQDLAPLDGIPDVDHQALQLAGDSGKEVDGLEGMDGPALVRGALKIGSLERFDDKIKRGFIAGNIGGTFWSAGSRRVTAGVDCSGLVSNVWHLDHHAGTSELPDLTEPVARLDRMHVGDVLLLPDHHVALYREQVDLDGASIGT